jgi:hypothetical protein
MSDNKNLMGKLAVQSARALTGLAVEGVSTIIRDGMEERKMGEDKLGALDTVTDVCRDMCPDMAGKVVDGLFLEEDDVIEIPENLEDFDE